ncbi:hypothetical protein ACO0LM_10405 [Undibacterium sp. Di26W]|uniref:hypothetical protein n=1 Tax=Undibacterium sp. Di26W TaxID=3413035 RepID=UPI003BF2B5A4
MPFNFLTHRIKPTELTAKEGPTNPKPGVFTGLYGRAYITQRQKPAKVQTSALLKKRG